jgi:hypothetical protein
LKVVYYDKLILLRRLKRGGQDVLQKGKWMERY